MNCKEQLYQQRLSRYLTAMRNEKPDCIPIRPFVAEFTAKYAGMTCQEVTHDYNLAFKAVRKCASDFDWDSVVSNMVYVWTGLVQAIGLKYYGIPGIDVPPDNGFQYLEPKEDKSFMKESEYDELIDDPTAFLYNVWLPRVSDNISPMHSPTSYRNNLALVKGGMAMLDYFNSFVSQNNLLRTECGTIPAISGILKAPFDIIGDKLRGYLGLTMDMITQPKKVLKACEALMPHLYFMAHSTSDQKKQLPIGFWMHRGCIPFISEGEFESHYWPTLKPIIEELWKNGHQTLFYAEGNWDHHLKHFNELPEKSIIYHIDKGDIFETNQILGNKFCLSGGIPNTLLSLGTPDEIRHCCKKVIDHVAHDGGYIMDASSIIQNDATVENMRILTDFTREYGVYSDGTAPLLDINAQNSSPSVIDYYPDFGMNPCINFKINPGSCIPWSEKKKEIPSISGDEELLKRIWEDVDYFGYMFIWQCLLSF